MTFLWILLALIVIVLLLDLGIEHMYRYEKSPRRATPAKFGLPFEEAHFPAEKGGQLYGWWIPASPSAPTLILVHGWGRNAERMMPYIRKLHPMGYNLLAFDSRNHGSSTPEKHPTVWTFTQDVLAAAKFLITSGRASSGRIGVIGLSVGGGAAINASALDDGIKSVITVGAFSHPVEVMMLEFQKRHVPSIVAWLLFKYMRLRFGLDFDRIAPVNHISRSQARILLIHGDKDATIPLAQGQALAEAGNPGRTRLWIVPGKGHSNCNTHPEFWEKVGAFLDETLPASA